MVSKGRGVVSKGCGKFCFFLFFVVVVSIERWFFEFRAECPAPVNFDSDALFLLTQHHLNNSRRRDRNHATAKEEEHPEEVMKR